MNDLQVQCWPLDRLVPYARNARTHSDEQVTQIAASIVEFGFNCPVLVDERGEIIAGHGRVLAARKLGFVEAPVIVLAHLTDAQKRAFRIADNKIALNADWNEDLLRLEFDALRELDFDLDLTSFDLDEIDRLLQGSEPEPAGNTDDDEVPEAPEEPVTRPGDLWILGDHRLLCGDATVLADVEKVMGGGLADMVFTDPPYNVDYGNSAKDKVRGKDRRILNDNLGEGFERFLYDACLNILTVTKGAVYVCMSSSELHTLQRAFKEAGGHWSTFVIWAKNTFTLGRSDYQRQYEPILYGWKERRASSRLTPYYGTEDRLISEVIDMQGTTIGEAARMAGVGVETIRFYERTRLIERPPKPRNSGFRSYPAETVARVRFIRQAQELGFSLREVRELLELRADPGADAADVRARAAAKLDDVNRKITQLGRIRGALKTLIAACPGRGALRRCSIMEALEPPDAATRSRDRRAGPRLRRRLE